MNKFLIVDDHHIFRQGVKKIISDSFSRVLFGEASNTAEALSILKNENWNLVVLDINMPGRSGLDFIKDALSINPKLLILVLSMFQENKMAIRALKAGAKGYLAKDKTAECLIDAIARILKGNSYINQNVSELLLREINSARTEDLTKTLSDREYFVLMRLVEGETVTGISKLLSLSIKTISTYRTRIMHKLGVTNTVQLIRLMKDKIPD